MFRRPPQISVCLPDLRIYALALFIAVGLLVAVPGLTLAQTVDRIDAILETPPSISDDFSSNRDFWTTPYDGDTSRFFKSRRFHIVVDIPDTVAYSRGDATLDDFYAEVDTQHIAGNTSNQLGLVFRFQDEGNFYFFAIGNDGYYALLKLENNSWSNLIQWTRSEIINSGSAARNRVGVLADGSSIAILVNDELLEEIEDHSFASGQIALTAGSYEQPGIEIAFDNFALWRLGEVAEETPVAPPPLSTLQPTEDSALTLIESLWIEDLPDYMEFFADGDGGWDVFETENVLTQHTDEGLVILVRAPQRLGSSVYPRTVTDFYMEVDLELLFGPLSAEAGFVFREQDADNYYFYAITHEGYFSLWRKRNAEWQALMDWTFSEELETGEGAFNTLGVLAQGERITLVANNEIVAETSDSAFSSGSIAVTVGTFDEPDAQVAFSGVFIWDLDVATLEAPPAQRPESPESDEPEVDEPEETGFDAEARLAEILAEPSTFQDDFRRNTGAWDIEGDELHEFIYRERALLGELNTTEWVAWSALLRNLTDFYFEVDGAQVNDVEDGSYGIIFRLQNDENFYQFRVSIYGNYSVWKSIDADWINLVEWTTHPAINEGVDVVNRLGVLAEGSNLAFVINGEVVHTMQDADLPTGTVALFLETLEDIGLQVSFDNAELWDLSRR